MSQTKQSKYLLTLLIAVSSQSLLCMDNPAGQPPAPNVADIKFAQQQEKLTKLQNKNSLKYRAVTNIGDHAAKGFIDFVANTASQSILEAVRRELDVRYDGRPITTVQLSEIHSGLTIINDALELTEKTAKKLISNTKDAQEKIDIENDAIETYRHLSNLRKEHINRLTAIQQKRNPDFKPFQTQQK